MLCISHLISSMQLNAKSACDAFLPDQDLELEEFKALEHQIKKDVIGCHQPSGGSASSQQHQSKLTPVSRSQPGRASASFTSKQVRAEPFAFACSWETSCYFIDMSLFLMAV